MAAFHLTEELEHRGSFRKLPEADIRHLQGDVIRVETIRILEWLRYMKHLKSNYPYLFSLAVRTNPFNRENHVVFKD